VEAFDLSQVAQAVRETTNVDGDVRGRIAIRPNFVSDLVRVIARDRSPSAAVTLADAFTAQAVKFVRVLDALSGARLPLGDFEAGFGGWGSTSHFASPPLSLRVVHTTSKYNSHALQITCGNRPGCGSAFHINFPFRKGLAYSVSGWARAPIRRLRLTMILGATPKDYAAMPPKKVGTAWSRYSVSWVPKHNYASGEVTFQTNSGSAGSFYIDGVSMSAVTARVMTQLRGPLKEANAFAARSADVISPAVATGTVKNRTLLWALVGAALGFVAASWIVGLGWSAARHR
jgi:hypothetical protein